jgi:hypothetical protein
VQDLTLLKSRWPKEADSFLSMFGHVLVYPGIRDPHTLDALSKLVGNIDKRKITETHTGPSDGWSETTERVPKFDPSVISEGVATGDPDILLHLSPKGWGQILATPYWRAPPWPQILTRYFEMALSGQVPDWVWLEAACTGDQEPHEDALPFLPVPDLRECPCGSRPYDLMWGPRYHAMIRGERPPPRLAVYERPPRAGYGPNFATEGSAQDRWWVAGMHSPEVSACMSRPNPFEPQRRQLP